jgi:hypothetical protein
VPPVITGLPVPVELGRLVLVLALPMLPLGPLG